MKLTTLLFVISILVSGSFAQVLKSIKSEKKTEAAVTASNSRFVFIGEFILPEKVDGLDEPVGGLSGITYDSKSKSFIAVSDDRAIKGPARVYRWPLALDSTRSPASLPEFPLRDLKPFYLKDIKGKPFGKMSVDYEGIAYHPNGTIYVSSEGDQRLFAKTPPSISAFDSNGKELYQFLIPEVFWNSKIANFGVRNNRAFEGLSVNALENRLYAANEEPLSQDRNSQLIRIQEFDLTEKKATRQFTYPLEPGPDNGVSELLSLGAQKFFILERQYIEKEDKIVAKIFEADCQKAEDSQAIPTLIARNITHCSKKMVLDMDSILPSLSETYRKIDNLEGMTFGPELPGGGKWFFLISDNNFSDHQRTQILAFHWFPQ